MLTSIYNLLLNLFRPNIFDDAVDRLSYVNTATLLTLFSIIVGSKQFVGSPIHCVTPLDFNGAWERYAEEYCMSHYTYIIPEPIDIPGGIDDRHKSEVGYYLWIPVVLVLQAIMFKVPSWIWSSLHKPCGLDLQSVMNNVDALRSCNLDTRKNAISRVVQIIEQMDSNSENTNERRNVFKKVWRWITFWIDCRMASILYTVVKLMYIFNGLLQFYILYEFLGSETFLWGFHTLADLKAGRHSSAFPRVTSCDFTIPIMGTMKQYSVQCVLSLNIFNEKIFCFLWFWFVFVLVTTLINNIFTICRQWIPCYRHRFVRSLLKYPYKKEGNRRAIERFVHGGLSMDVTLLIRLVDNGLGSAVSREICEHLFEKHRHENLPGNQFRRHTH